MKKTLPGNLSERDKKHLWHPLTQHKTHPDSLPIVKAQGALLYDENGKEYIDGIASWYTCMYGHCNPYILERVSLQMHTLDQVVFSGFTHEPAITLSEELVKLLPENQEKLFFSDNGSTATEVAIKMALQFHYNQGSTRTVLLAFEDGFHGDTFGAMSASGLSVYNGPFTHLLMPVERIPVPKDQNLDQILSLLETRLQKGDVAGFIYEPLVQGAAGMKMHKATSLDSILELTRNYGVLNIADEVMTGFGKTGKHFASDHMRIQPDIMCLSKALTAGLMPMAITSCSMQVYDAFYSDDLSKGLFHAHTYTANPLACTAALAGLELLKSQEIQDAIQRIIAAHRLFDASVRTHPRISGTRQCGIIYALDLDLKSGHYGVLRDQLFSRFMDQGVFLRPLGNTIYIVPPFVITEMQLQKIYRAISVVLDTV